ncbi:MAG TPA: Spy/CpxP family protein refolding chaperone [Steroidobacteraceae bacterium]|jgi:Spy/CpxP family protein refolding chaperone|nr:Spy/CpxP family protein refolding chaperone [Steroidobacteraceae bacterium]
MDKLRKMVPALCLATSLAGLAAYTAVAQTTTGSTTEGPAATGAPGPWHGHGHHGHRGGMFFVLHKLNLTPEQKTQIKAIFAEQKSQYQALRASVKANHQALATTPPTDPNYATLLQTAEKNATTRIELMSQTWTAIYGKLTPQQQQAIPGIVAAAQQAREAREAEWKAQHGSAAAPAAE